MTPTNGDPAMTITDTRPEPAVIDGEITGSSTTVTNPHRVSTVVSAVIVLGAAAAFLTNLHGDPGGKTVKLVVLLAAIAVYVFFLVRANAWNER